MNGLDPRWAHPCGHVTEGIGECGATPTRLYLPGYRCKAHTPAALARPPRPENKPDPARTAAGIRAAHGADPNRSWTTAGDTGIDSQARASGKRRSSTAQQRVDRAHVEAHR